MDFKEQIKPYQDRINQAIEQWSPAPDTHPALLHEAMRYSLDAGGKRLRPILTVVTAEILKAPHNPLPAAIAIECVHTYSLIHDDLPAMDNSALRRGLPTCHVRFDEATAILAGDALLTYAFELISEAYEDHPKLGLALTRVLARGSGSRKLIGGQMLDVLTERGRPYDQEDLQFIHKNKTAALIQAALLMGGLLSESDEAILLRLEELGLFLGLAFQIVDDILDATGNAAALGKPAGADADNNKATAVSIMGMDSARKAASENTERARELAQALPGNPAFLVSLVEYLENRMT